MIPLYLADHSSECSKCGFSPTVIVVDQETNRPENTLLCGMDFFQDKTMIDPSEWNEDREATE
jgi:hypothetical protein